MDQDVVNISEKGPSSKLENKGIDEAKDIDNEGDHYNADKLEVAKDITNKENNSGDVKVLSEQEIKNAELPDVDPDSVNVLNRDMIGELINF